MFEDENKASIIELRGVIDQQNIQIESLVIENDRLRKAHAKSEKRNKLQSSVILRYRKMLMVIEEKLGVDLDKEIENVEDDAVKAKASEGERVLYEELAADHAEYQKSKAVGKTKVDVPDSQVVAAKFVNVTGIGSSSVAAADVQNVEDADQAIADVLIDIAGDDKVEDADAGEKEKKETATTTISVLDSDVNVVDSSDVIDKMV